jgi:serine/threonine protein kinase
MAPTIWPRSGSGSCPSEEEIFAYVAGSTRSEGDPERLLMHLDTCETCRRLIAEAARAAQGPGAAVNRPGNMRTFAEGQMVVDRYRIGRFLARGGMGEVYLADDLLLEEQVALKTLSCTALDDPRAAFRFKAEARLARRVTHPNICRILEFGIQTCMRPGGLAESIPFLTMEFLAGETLSRRIQRRSRMPDHEAVPILKQVIAGLQAIHSCGIVHRDLKSENVFLVPDPRGGERVVVVDFGLARSVDGSVVSTWPLARVLAGTLDTMAPEQIEGRHPEPAVDIFAFGVLAFEVLTGRRPFVDVPPIKRLRDRAPAPSSVCPDLHPRWDRIIGHCLEIDPAHRYATLVDLAAALTRAQRPVAGM